MSSVGQYVPKRIFLGAAGEVADDVGGAVSLLPSSSDSDMLLMTILLLLEPVTLSSDPLVDIMLLGVKSSLDCLFLLGRPPASDDCVICLNLEMGAMKRLELRSMDSLAKVSFRPSI